MNEIITVLSEILKELQDINGKLDDIRGMGLYSIDDIFNVVTDLGTSLDSMSTDLSMIQDDTSSIMINTL